MVMLKNFMELKWMRFLLLFVASVHFAYCGGESSTNRPENPLKYIKIYPADSTLKIGDEKSLSAVGTYSDGSSKTITDLLEWKSSAPNKATVKKGKVTGVLSGDVNISASLGGISARAHVLVEAASIDTISISPSNPDIPKGTSRQFTATAHRSNGTSDNITDQVVWSSSDEDIATISNVDGSKGRAAGLEEGIVTISAVLGSKSALAVLRVNAAAVVSIEVSPSSSTIAAGTNKQFTVMGTFTDASTHDVTDQVSWESSNETVATISNDLGSEGLAAGLSDGTITITAHYDDLISDQASLTVTSATLLSIDVAPSAPNVAKGLQQQFTATGNYDDATTQDLTDLVTWSSSDTNIATMDVNGLATSIAEGASVITATFGMVSGNANLTVLPPVLQSITVSPGNSSIRNGTLQQLTAVGTYSDESTLDISDSVTWASSDTNVATISNVGGSEGQATSVAPGTATVSATLGMISGNTNLTVLNVNLISLEVTPANPSIAIDTSLHFVATGHFDDASTQDLTEQVEWASSDTNVATISNALLSQGRAYALIDGATTITAARGVVSGNTVLTVTPATLVSMVITPDASSIAKGYEQQFTAMGTFSDASVQDITEDVVWASSDTNAVTISNAVGSEGLASTLAEGAITISATLGMVSDDTTFTVTAPELVSIDVTPADVTLAVGATRQFMATGTYSDNSTQNLTTQVVWSSSSTGVATISNSGGSEGLATAVSEGATSITATLGLISGSATLEVDTALSYVTISPSTTTLKKNRTRQLTGRAYFTDGSSVNVTNSLSRWTTSNSSIIKVNHGNTPGNIRAMNNNGSATITFTYTIGGVTKSATLTVTAIP